MSQTIGMHLAEKISSRKNTIVTCVKLQAFLVLSPLTVIYGPTSCGAAAATLICLVSLYHMTIGMIAPLWNSLVGDLTPPTSRGEFFGHRNMWMSIATFLALFQPGEIIHLATVRGNTGLGYAIVFTVAAVSRFFSGSCLASVPDTVLHVPENSKFTFWQFIRRAKHSNFMRFTFFITAMNFATALSGPYFAMYMLNDLCFLP